MHTPNFKSHIQQTMRNSKQLRRASEGNLQRTLTVALGQSTESLCGYTNLHKKNVPGPDAATANSTAKQFAIHEVNI
jgi:hypothetical protein